MKIALPFPIIKILGQVEAEKVVDISSAGKWNVVSLWSGGGGKHGMHQPDFRNREKALCQHRFHDIAHAQEGMIMCSEEQQRDILDFAKARRGEMFIVHCYAGISRSSATTFNILLDYFAEQFPNEPETIANHAFHLLTYYKNPALIRPNPHILNLGVKLVSERHKIDQGDLDRAVFQHPIYRRFFT